MKKWKKLLSLGMVMVLTLSLAACGGDKEKAPAPPKESDTASTVTPGDAEYPKMTWRVANAVQEGSASDIACLAFKEFVEEKTGGNITVEYFPGGQLGADAAMIESVQLQELDFASVGPYGLATATGVWGCILWDIPFFFPMDAYNADVYGMLWDDPAYQDVYGTQLSAKGLHTMGIMMQGDYCIFSNKPVRKTSDMAGMKIRATENAMLVDVLTEWGAQPTVVNMFECYTAMEQGMIDAAYIVESVAHQMSLEDACDYVTYFEGNPGPVMMICNEDFYQAQDPLVQALIDEAGQVYQEAGFEAYKKLAPELVKTLEEAGCEIIWLTEEEKAEWAADTAKAYEIWREKCGAETFDAAKEYIDNVIKPELEKR